MAAAGVSAGCGGKMRVTVFGTSDGGVADTRIAQKTEMLYGKEVLTDAEQKQVGIRLEGALRVNSPSCICGTPI